MERKAGFDPIRDALSLKMDKKGRWITGIILCVLFCGALLFVLGLRDTSPVAAGIGALCFGMMLLLMWPTMEKDEPLLLLLCSALLVMLGIMAHLTLLEIKPGRIARTLTELSGEMWNYDLLTAMAWEANEWSGGYLIVMAIFSRFENLSLVYAVKLLDLVFVCLGAAAVHRLSLRAGARPVAGILAAGCALLAPTVLLNTGCWGQCDAIFSALTLWGLYFLLSSHPIPGCLLWGLAVGFKLQSAFIFPLLFPFFMDRKVSIRHILLILVGFLALHIPMILDGQDLLSIFSRYNEQILTAAYGGVGLTDNAPGVYGLMNIASVREFSGMGLFFSIAFALLLAIVMIRRLPLFTEDYLRCAVLLAFGLPLILPQMNVRMFYLAFLLALTCARNTRDICLAVAIEFISLLGYMTGIFGTNVFPLTVISMMALCVNIFLLLNCLSIGRGGKVETENANG